MLPTLPKQEAEPASPPPYFTLFANPSAKLAVGGTRSGVLSVHKDCHRLPLFSGVGSISFDDRSKQIAHRTQSHTRVSGGRPGSTGRPHFQSIGERSPSILHQSKLLSRIGTMLFNTGEAISISGMGLGSSDALNSSLQLASAAAAPLLTSGRKTRESAHPSLPG
eukprot:6481332-Amphidinium_carterae.1